MLYFFMIKFLDTLNTVYAVFFYLRFKKKLDKVCERFYY